MKRKERPQWETCLFCQQRLIDGREDSGYTGLGTDWMTADGYYGCDYNPTNSEEGVGQHWTLFDATGLYLAGEFDYSRRCRDG